ncbi:MAG: insulinase family protein [Gammaproteobacteria bacterium]|nr:insulinase family protein [Gammaproteobacteria bacterium]MDH3414680.1 insulinase family protein [Gammaproteobacteria bacterium]
MAFFAELRRRNVFKVALLFAVASWLVVWLLDGARESVQLPVWTETFVYVVIALGFPLALLFAWTYEITPTGLKKAIDVDQTQSLVFKTGQKLNAAVSVLLVLGALAVVGERLLPTFEFLVPGVPEGDAPMATTTPPEIRSLTLDNGLKIIVWPDHDIPNVVMYTFVRAGGRNEYPGITGVSHFFEHMMFLGTDKRAPGEFDTTMEAAGGANNAYTSSDVTVYQDWFPRSALETIFELEGDRFENLAIVPEVFESERKVVYSERRSGIDNNNFRMLGEQVQATAYVAHPYQFTVIGWPSDIESWTQEDLANYYRTYYAPNNRTVVVSGDVTTEEIFELAEEYFAPTPAQEPPPPIRTVEPEQLGPRRLVVETSAQTPMLHLAFHAASAADPETLSMNLLLNILVGGESSRLHQLLVEKEGLAISVGGYQDEGFDPGLAYFYLTLPPGGDPAELERRVLDELARVADEGVTDAELNKARNIVLADFWRELATINGKASAIGNYEVFQGNYEKLFRLPADMEAITSEDLRAVAAQVFRVNNMTAGVLRAPDAEGSQ